MCLFLDYYNTPQAPDWCCIEGYKIDKVVEFAPGMSEPLYPQGDFMREVWFSIKLIQIPNAWMPRTGTIDQQNWFHTAEALAITEVSKRNTKGVYAMKFARS